MKIQLPHNYQPRDYQLPLLRALDSGIKRAVYVAHRRSGKDKTLLNYTIKKMAERVGVYYYFLPTYSQARKIIWEGIGKDGFKFIDHFPKDFVQNINKVEMSITTINGSIFRLVGTDKIDSIVGTNPIGCVFSEYSLQSPKAWDMIRPILAENDGWAIFNFTPRGRNHGWKILQQAKADPSWYWEVLPVTKTKAIPQDVLDQERREMPEALYKQEYECEFLDGAGSFFRNIRTNLYSLRNPPNLLRTNVKLGVDLAKYMDFTVITPFDLTTFTVGIQDRFNQIDWTTQEGRIEAAYYKHGANRITIDATGVGDPIVERLRQRGLPILDEDAFKFTEQSRDQLLRHLSMLLEQNKLLLPDDEGLLSELESFQYELTERGKVKITAPEGLHDDRVMSLALAVWGCHDRITPTAYNYSNRKSVTKNVSR